MWASAGFAHGAKLEENVGDALRRQRPCSRPSPIFWKTLRAGGQRPARLQRGLYEGALRQAAFARWPGVVPAGRVADGPWAFWDFLPTAVELAGAKFPAGYKSDGISLVSYLRGGPAPPRDSFYWELHEQRPIQAVRFGQWKAVRNGHDRPIELYDLATDAAESKNLAAAKPDLVAQAEALMKAAHTPDRNWPRTGRAAHRQAGAAKKKAAGASIVRQNRSIGLRNYGSRLKGSRFSGWKCMAVEQFLFNP